MLVSALNKEINKVPSGGGGPLKRTILRLRNANAEGAFWGRPKKGTRKPSSGDKTAWLAARRVKSLLTWKLYRLLGALWSGCGFLGGMESHVKTTLSFRDYRII